MDTIKTTQGKALNAYSTINRIRNKIKGKDALNLFHLKNVLQENVDFQVEQERSLVEEYGGTVTETGAVLIEDKDRRLEFQQAYRELQEMECEVKTEPLTMSIDRNPDITLDDIEQLDGFIIFK